MRVEYSDNKKTAYFDDMKFTRDEKTGYYLSTRKVGNRRVRLHVYVWSFYNGDVPKGYQIHHKDEDKSNNDISNLDCLTLHDHLSYHSSSEANIRILREYHDACIEASKGWHRSDAGHDWHMKHYEEFKDRLHEKVEIECQYCGKKFISVKNSKFCCSAHRAYARRKSGADNIEAICVMCGKPFVKNKYEKTRTCGKECKAELRKATMRGNSK